MRARRRLLGVVLLWAAGTGCAAPLPASNAPVAGTGRVLLEEKFTDPTWQEGEGEHCSYHYVPQGFQIKNIAPEGSCRIVIPGLGSLGPHVRVEAVLEKTSGAKESGYGLFFGGHEAKAEKFFTFALRETGTYGVSEFQNGEWTEITKWNFDPLIRRGAGVSNRVLLEIFGNTVSYYVNDASLGAIQTEEGISGELGIYLDEPGGEVLLHEVRVVDFAQSTGAAAPVLRPEEGEGPRQSMAAPAAPAEDLIEGEACEVVRQGEGMLITHRGEPGVTCEADFFETALPGAGGRVWLTVEVRHIPRDGAYGLKFAVRPEEPGSFYVFLAQGDGKFALVRSRDNQWEVLQHLQRAPATGETKDAMATSLELQMRGGEVVMRANGLVLGRYWVGAADGGRAGVLLLGQGTSIVVADLGVGPLP